MLPLRCPLFPAFLPGLLFGPGLILFKVLLWKRRPVRLLQLREHLLSLFLPVLVLVADGVGVDCRLGEIGEGFAPQLRHLRQTEEGKTPS